LYRPPDTIIIAYTAVYVKRQITFFSRFFANFLRNEKGAPQRMRPMLLLFSVGNYLTPDIGVYGIND
jgi:hypothetical protein